jgi:hypothetical protein
MRELFLYFLMRARVGVFNTFCEWKISSSLNFIKKMQKGCKLDKINTPIPKHESIFSDSEKVTRMFGGLHVLRSIIFIDICVNDFLRHNFNPLGNDLISETIYLLSKPNPETNSQHLSRSVVCSRH